MPYPPSFDHTWDITTPADTQPANQGGADFRNLKDDVMQRMALLSGTFANRPTPETVNATWGGTGYGLIYFSTDTKQFFVWSGSAWVDNSTNLPNVSGTSNFSDVTQGTVTNPGGAHVVQSVTLPASFTTGKIARLRVSGSISFSSSPGLELIGGLTSYFGFIVGGTGGNFLAEIELLATTSSLLNASAIFTQSTGGGSVTTYYTLGLAYTPGETITFGNTVGFTGTLSTNGMSAFMV